VLIKSDRCLHNTIVPVTLKELSETGPHKGFFIGNIAE
jgi:hypothetical protein